VRLVTVSLLVIAVVIALLQVQIAAQAVQLIAVQIAQAIVTGQVHFFVPVNIQLT